jgi:hypothetical protein
LLSGTTAAVDKHEHDDVLAYLDSPEGKAARKH